MSCSFQKCRLQVSAVLLLFETDLFSSFISLLLPHCTWFYSLSCPSMAVTRGSFIQKWNQAYSHRRYVLLPKLSNLNYYSSSENGFTVQYLWHYCPFLTYPTWLIDELIDLCWGMGSALTYPWMLTQGWEQLHGKSVVTGFLGHLLPACLDLEKDICPLSEHVAKGPVLITDGCSVQ